MAIKTLLQQIIDERISFLREQINPANKPEMNRTFQIQIDAIRSAAAADDLEKVEAIITQKKELLKNSKDTQEVDRLLAELEALEWLQAQIAVLYTLEEQEE
jgi:phosphoserine aminotransferase